MFTKEESNTKRIQRLATIQPRPHTANNFINQPPTEYHTKEDHINFENYNENNHHHQRNNYERNTNNYDIYSAPYTTYMGPPQNIQNYPQQYQQQYPQQYETSDKNYMKTDIESETSEIRKKKKKELNKKIYPYWWWDNAESECSKEIKKAKGGKGGKNHKHKSKWFVDKNEISEYSTDSALRNEKNFYKRNSKSSYSHVPYWDTNMDEEMNQGNSGAMVMNKLHKPKPKKDKDNKKDGKKDGKKRDKVHYLMHYDHQLNYEGLEQKTPGGNKNGQRNEENKMNNENYSPQDQSGGMMQENYYQGNDYQGDGSGLMSSNNATGKLSNIEVSKDMVGKIIFYNIFITFILFILCFFIDYFRDQYKNQMYINEDNNAQDDGQGQLYQNYLDGNDGNNNY